MFVCGPVSRLGSFEKIERIQAEMKRITGLTMALAAQISRLLRFNQNLISSYELAGRIFTLSGLSALMLVRDLKVCKLPVAL